MTSTPADTIANARSVPIETNSPRMPIGKRPATIIATVPVTIVVMYGVLNFEWTAANFFGSKPSFAML